jgi:DNA polymerase I-like protein with 3'-5' exonuclease and polymerase domains
LIQPPPGHGVAYIDWSQQEFGIAAALSGDPAMTRAYLSGDPYLEFAKQAGAVPADATKASHGPTRELFKQCVLAVGYGMEAPSLAARIGQPVIVARDLLRAYRETFQQRQRWADAAVDHALVHGKLHTVFGWEIHVGANPNLRSLRNFPAQANGAEMLRLACCFATERGIEICAPVHDAVLICAPLDRLEADIAGMRAAMAEASRIVLSGFELRTDVQRFCHPDRFADPRGDRMWRQVMQLIDRRTKAPGAAASECQCVA